MNNSDTRFINNHLNKESKILRQSFTNNILPFNKNILIKQFYIKRRLIMLNEFINVLKN